jgi:hypothetical protein
MVLRYTHALMWRSVAIVLTLVFSSLLMLPAFVTSAESNLAPCCRKGGKHHCLMQPESPSASGASFAANSEKCRYFPHSTAAAHVETFTPALNQGVFAGILLHATNCLQAEAGYRASYFRSKQKRGPPFFFLS